MHYGVLCFQVSACKIAFFLLCQKAELFNAEHFVVLLTFYGPCLVGGNDRFSWYALIKTSALQMLGDMEPVLQSLAEAQFDVLWCLIVLRITV